MKIKNKKPKSYLIVFHGDIKEFCSKGIIKDISDDPCFDNPPTWGICRPTTRKYVNIGDNLFFIAYYKPLNEYYLKGWFEIGEKITYFDALKRFPNRKNVIIANNKKLNRKFVWRYKDLKKAYQKKYSKIKQWLEVINSNNKQYFQNPLDEHEIDNWKCRRIFHCRAKQFLECIKKNKCIMESEFLNKKNYIVANESKWKDVSNSKINFITFLKSKNIQIAIKTPKGQHNVIDCSVDKDIFFNLINQH